MTLAARWLDSVRSVTTLLGSFFGRAVWPWTRTSSRELATLLSISLVIIANTIKLPTFTRREEIAILKMCGATDGFIEWPFVVEGMILGLSGALIAFLAQWGLYQMVAKLAIQGNGLSMVNMLSYSSMATTILAVFCAVGAVIGVGGSLLAIRKFLQV